MEKAIDNLIREVSSQLTLEAQLLALSEIKRLVATGDINKQNEYGETALNITAKFPIFFEISAMLLVEGADSTIPTNCRLPVGDYYFVHYDNPERGGSCLPLGCGFSPFMTAIKSRNHQLEELLLEYETDFNREAACGNTLLTLATRFNSPIAEELIDRGANIYHQVSDYNMLSVCIDQNNVQLFKKLWNIADYEKIWRNWYSTILAYCLERNRYEIFEIIIDSDRAQDVVQSSAFIPSQTVSYILSRYHLVYSEEKLERAIYTLLSYGYTLTDYELCNIYEIFGFNALFELCLHLDTESFPFRSSYLIPMLSYHPTVTVEEIIESYLVNWGEKFTTSSTVDITRFIVCERLYGRLLNCVFELDKELERKLIHRKIPSLQDLSRNVCRTAIATKYYVTKASEFYTILNHLPIPRLLKDIIAFKEPLYR